MQKLQKKWILGVLVSTALFNCVGSNNQGGKDTNSTGPTVTAPEATSSIAWVYPNRLAKGRTHIVTVLGSATRFSTTTKLDFGADVTVLETKLLSEVTIEATVTVSDTAALGSRNLTVTVGEKTLTGNNLISILDSATGVSNEGILAQGSEGSLRIETTAPSYFAPGTGSNGAWEVSNATFKTESKALQVAETALWMHNQSALLAYRASPFATKETVEIIYSDTRKETVQLQFAPSESVALTEATPSEVSLSKTTPFKVLSFTTEANRGFTLQVNLEAESQLAPRLRAYVEGKAEPLALVTGNRILVPAATSSRLVKLVLSDSSNNLTDTPEKLTLEVTQTALPDIGTCASGECTLKWTLSSPIAIPQTPEPSLIKTFLVESTTPCIIEKATANWEVTHTYPSDIIFSFIFPDGTYPTSEADVFRVEGDETPAGQKTTGTETKTTEPWLGKSALGLWTLDVRDWFTPDTGTLDSFELKITCAPNN